VSDHGDLHNSGQTYNSTATTIVIGRATARGVVSPGHPQHHTDLMSDEITTDCVRPAELRHCGTICETVFLQVYGGQI